MAEPLIDQLEGYIGTQIQVTINGTPMGRVMRLDGLNKVVYLSGGSIKYSEVRLVQPEMP